MGDECHVFAVHFGFHLGAERVAFQARVFEEVDVVAETQFVGHPQHGGFFLIGFQISGRHNDFLALVAGNRFFLIAVVVVELRGGQFFLDSGFILLDVIFTITGDTQNDSVGLVGAVGDGDHIDALAHLHAIVVAHDGVFHGLFGQFCGDVRVGASFCGHFKGDVAGEWFLCHQADTEDHHHDNH